jgi:lipoate synthase
MVDLLMRIVNLIYQQRDDLKTGPASHLFNCLNKIEKSSEGSWTILERCTGGFGGLRALADVLDLLRGSS